MVALDERYARTACAQRSKAWRASVGEHDVVELLRLKLGQVRLDLGVDLAGPVRRQRAIEVPDDARDSPCLEESRSHGLDPWQFIQGFQRGQQLWKLAHGVQDRAHPVELGTRRCSTESAHAVPAPRRRGPFVNRAHADRSGAFRPGARDFGTT